MKTEIVQVFRVGSQAGELTCPQQRRQRVRDPIHMPWDGYSGYFADPYGHLWEVVWIHPPKGQIDGHFPQDRSPTKRAAADAVSGTARAIGRRPIHALSKRVDNVFLVETPRIDDDLKSEDEPDCYGECRAVLVHKSDK